MPEEKYNLERAGMFRPLAFLRDTEQSVDELYELTRNSSAAGVGGFIPLQKLGDASNEEKTESLRMLYSKLLPVAEKFGMAVAFTLAPCIEATVISAEDTLWEDTIRARKLVRHTHYCSQDEKVDWELFPGKLLSAVAYNEDTDVLIDLRDNIADDRIRFDPPRGNWRVVQYGSLPDYDSDRVNILSKYASKRYFDAAYDIFADIFAPYLGKTLTHMYYYGLAFKSVNRHDWSDEFNEVFESRYGFDPAPYYPYLFASIGSNPHRFKALFSDCRARMLRDGYISAAEEFASKHSLLLIGTLSECKSTQCSPITGDALLNNTATPAAVLDRGYLYGLNSVKVAAGAAFGRAKRDIFVELYHNYKELSFDIMIRDAAHAFARGANLPAMHLPEPEKMNKEEISRLLRLVSAMRTCLESGRQISDIAVIYPIYYLHSSVNMYSAEISGFEYPDTPADADYMSVINTVCLCAGHDVTLLHPDVIARSAEPDGNVLRLTGMSDDGGFKVVILPSQKVASLAAMRVLRDYFDAGGKIIATGQLPVHAFEYDPSDTEKNDKEMREISEHIFGKDALDPGVMNNYCYNFTSTGGEAYFLYFAKTGIDGISVADSKQICRALESFGVAFDLYAPKMPRYETTGALNASFTEYVRLGLHKHLPDGGMFSHIHKKNGDADVYFFANTANIASKTPVFLRGAHVPICYDPETGKRWREKYEYVAVRDKVYTRLDISMEPTSFLVVFSMDGAAHKRAIVPSVLRDCTDEAHGNKN